MRPRTPEGPRFLRSDGTPEKLTRVHKEYKWVQEVGEPEALHSPSTTFRAVLLDMLNTHRLNVIVADGDKYVGIATLPKLAAAISLWRERETPIYKILLEPLKRIEEKVEPLVDGMGVKEVAEVLRKLPPAVDEAPVVKEEKVVGVLKLREVIAKYVSDVTLGSLAVRIPTVGSVGEALMEMENKDLPVVMVEDRALDARDVAKRIWEERTKPVGSVHFEDLLTEPYEVFKESVTLREALEHLDPHKVDYILVELGEGYGIVSVPKLAAHLIHP